MLPHILGEHPLAKDANGRLKSRIATVCPYGNTIVTLPGIHATQRLAYVEMLSRQRPESGLAPLSREEETARMAELRRRDRGGRHDPDPARPDNMALGFRADELLQELVPKHRVKFLLVRDRAGPRRDQAAGRMLADQPLAQDARRNGRMIAASRIAIHGDELYYYSKATGTRLLTCEAFSQLGALDDAALRQHLRGDPRVFRRDQPPRATGRSTSSWPGQDFSKADFAPCDFDAMDARGAAGRLRNACGRSSTTRSPPSSAKTISATWSGGTDVYAALIGEDEKSVSEESLLGLSSEFFMQIEWLPGGRIEEGELIFDSAFDLAEETGDPELRRLCDEKCRGFIFNFVREYGDLEYVNIGRVVESLSQRGQTPGRRDVYIAQVKQQGIPDEIIKIIRMQKWGIREHLDEGEELLDAIIQSEEYTEYILDRRLGCRQLGMNLPARTTAKRISERYPGPRREVHSAMIWSPYFERDYIRGMATDKIPPQKLADAAFASRLARLLGQAAAPNADRGTVRRAGPRGVRRRRRGGHRQRRRAAGRDRRGRSNGDVSTDYLTDLEHFAAEYAERGESPASALLADPEEFAAFYVDAFVARFSRIQLEYRKRKRAFDRLFKHRPRDEAGSFAYRWECVLDRLRRAVPQNLGRLIRSHVAAVGST